MPGKSTYAADKFLNHTFRGQAFSMPGAVYVSLHTGDPELGNEVPATGSYARVGVTGNTSNWTAPADGTAGQRFVQNVNAIIFPDPTGDWASGAPITHFALFDAATGGNLLYSAALAQSRTVLDTDNPPQFAAGALKVRES
jgi:hypothetical protein